MENQGFEEESRHRCDATTAIVPATHQDAQPVPFDLSKMEFFTDGSASNADGHVYEDILPNIEDISNPSRVLEYMRRGEPTETLNRSDRITRDPGIRSLDRQEIGRGFRRNFTLPFRRGTGLGTRTSNSSVRLAKTRDVRNATRKEDAIAEETWNDDHVHHDRMFSQEIAVGAHSTPLQNRIEFRSNRRRRKKDCKHCRNKAGSANDAQGELAIESRVNEPVFSKNHDSWTNLNDPRAILDPCTIDLLPAAWSPNLSAVVGTDPAPVFTISEMNGSEKNRAGMRVNSMYSQDRSWYAKQTPMISADLKEKEYASFQRAYSLPGRTQTPSSQNRINLRRSVRGEPAPHPARLRKHRHGWTLHLAHPLEASGCNRSLVVLLIALLVLVGIGTAALYIALEPDKLQFIQQYLRSAANASTPREKVLDAGTSAHSLLEEPWNETWPEWTTIQSILKPELIHDSSSSVHVNVNVNLDLNLTTRYCDDCTAEEVCVALVDEEVPTCRIPLDVLDPTGCAGFCLINKQKCHRLDIDAFRCVEVEHYCLDGEWTCLNTLCIPLEKLCDGHMNCYDHSDEYNCACDLETHFQCGNDTSCLPLEKRCDGKIDCWDAADEINCTLGRNLGGSCPSENEFTCSNGQCIPKARFCDGLPDCSDGSDEPHGCQGRCNKHEFTCQNNRCIMKGMKCNGADDCGDESDERHCKDRFA